MTTRPTFSLIVPTRGRPVQLRRFLDSVARTARRPDRLEVVLVVDDDDPHSRSVGHPSLKVVTASGPAGRTMGALNAAGYAASAGEYVMLLNDDVVARSRGWDVSALRSLRTFPDGIGLVHMNDTLMRHHLCTFPLVPRVYCELAGGICPPEYRRYRIDDHIEDVFNLLYALGERRAVYMPDVVFEHLNAVEHPTAGRVYQSDPAVLAEDAPRFDALLPARKDLAVRLLGHIRGVSDPAVLAGWRAALDPLADPLARRTADRHRVVRAPLWKRLPELAGTTTAPVRRAWNCYRRKGLVGVAGAARRRLTRATGG